MPVINGTSGADTLNGTSGVDTINGLGGDDNLRGLGGNDTLDGGTGYDYAQYHNDSANGGGGAITVDLGAGTATDGFGNTDTLISIEGVRGTALADTFYGSNRTDETEQFQGLAGNDTFNGLGGNDEVRYDRDFDFGGNGGVTVNLVTGTATDGFGNTDSLFFIEWVRGTNQADSITGNPSNNQFRGLGGADFLDGGAGFDLLRHDSDASNGGTAGITVTWTTNTGGTAVDGFGATDTFINMEGVIGTLSADTFTGAGGNEDFYGLQGADSLNGGDGFDWARYDRDASYAVTSGVTVNLATGVATDGFGNTDSLVAIEGIIGTNLNDNLTGDANGNGFVGLNGNDTFVGGDGFDFVNYGFEFAAAGINANNQTGTATGGAGGTDSLSGVEGIYGTNLADTIIGGNGSEDLLGNGGNDSLKGNDGGDFMRGGGGNDTLDGTAGALGDQSSGDADWAAYNDSGAATGVTVNLDTGTATDAFGGADTLIDIERVRGTNFADNISGSNTANLRQERFEGLSGNDTIDGRAGYDVVSYQSDRNNGGFNGVTVNLATGTATDGFGTTDSLSNIEGVLGTDFADSLTGNTGNNLFRVRGGNDTVDGGDGQDEIDFYLTDMIGGTGANVNMAAGTATAVEGSTITFTSIEVIGGSYSDDTIAGGNGNDNLNGNFGDDSITGGGGDDTIHGGKGVDTLDGGVGDSDWVSYVFDLTEAASLAADASRNAAFGWTGQNWTWTGVTVNLATNTMSGFDGAVDVISNFENIAGTYLADTLTGDGNDNRFRGYAGNDTIDGGAGSDTVVYSRNTSRTSGLALEGMVGEEPLGINVNLTTGIALAGTSGTDSLTSIENVVATAGNDTLVGNASVNNLTGGAGDDDYTISADDVVIEAAAGGTDTIRVGFGTVVMAANVENVVFSGYAGATLVTGNAEANTVAGTAAQNILNGLGGNDTLTGGGVNDVIDGGAGADSMTGGAGDDIYYTDDSGDSVVELAGGGSDVAYVSGYNGSLANVEQVLAYGAGALTATGDNGTNIFSAAALLRLAGVNYSALGGNDVLYGSNYADTLNGGADDDQLFGYGAVGGTDSLIGGGGNDLYVVTDAATVITENVGEGTDTVIALVNMTVADNVEQLIIGAGTTFTGNAVGNNLFGNNSTLALTLEGLGGNDWLVGGIGNDTLRGGGDNDILQGGAGTNNLEGGTGNDIYFSTSATDVVVENTGEGFETLYANYTVTALAANVEQVVVYGGATSVTGNVLGNAIYGNNSSVALTIDGAGGGDLVFGSGFADTVIGGLGNDSILAAGGADRITYNADGNMGSDFIYSFEDGTDLMVLTGRGYTAGSIGGAITIGGGANALVTFASGTLAGTSITLVGTAAASITAADFVF